MRRNTERRGVLAAALMLGMLAAVAAAPIGIAASPDDEAKIDINSATADELQALPGIGPSLAERILKFREKHGPFDTIEDLLKVQGIGEKTLDRFRDRVYAGKSRKS